MYCLHWTEKSRLISEWIYIHTILNNDVPETHECTRYFTANYVHLTFTLQIPFLTSPTILWIIWKKKITIFIHTCLYDPPVQWLALGQWSHHCNYLGREDLFVFFVQFFCVFLPPLLNIFCFLTISYHTNFPQRTINIPKNFFLLRILKLRAFAKE